MQAAFSFFFFFVIAIAYDVSQTFVLDILGNLQTRNFQNWRKFFCSFFFKKTERVNNALIRARCKSASAIFDLDVNIELWCNALPSRFIFHSLSLRLAKKREITKIPRKPTPLAQICNSCAQRSAWVFWNRRFFYQFRYKCNDSEEI